MTLYTIDTVFYNITRKLSKVIRIFNRAHNQFGLYKMTLTFIYIGMLNLMMPRNTQSKQQFQAKLTLSVVDGDVQYLMSLDQINRPVGGSIHR